jgi:hypothetical protein
MPIPEKSWERTNESPSSVKPMMPVCQAARSLYKVRSTISDMTHPFHLRLHAPLKFLREYLWQELTEPSPDDGVYDRVVRRRTPRAALREMLTAEDNKRALVWRRATGRAHKPVVPPVVGHEARQCKLVRRHPRAVRDGLPASARRRCARRAAGVSRMHMRSPRAQRVCILHPPDPRGVSSVQRRALLYSGDSLTAVTGMCVCAA